MRVLILVFVENPRRIQTVNPHFSVCVNDFLICQNKTNVNNSTFRVFKKCQIARFRFLNESQNFADFCLLISISWDFDAMNFINDLRKTTAIDSEKAFSTP
ncbi:hypothetical protein D3C86_1948330 [compost metagenome]